MFKWLKWILPGILTVAVLTLATAVFRVESVEADLENKLDKLLSDKFPWAVVSANGRDVTLTGNAPENVVARAANEEVSAVFGVRKITDDTGLLELASPYKFEILKHGTIISLIGNVPDHKARNAILDSISKFGGNQSIKNKMSFARGEPEGFGEAVNHLLQSLVHLEEGKFVISDKDIRISGIATANEGKEFKSAIEAQLPAGYRVLENAVTGNVTKKDLETTSNGVEENSVESKPDQGIFAPYRWGIKKSKNKMILSGAVSSELDRFEVLGLARLFNPGLELIDHQDVVPGGPAGLSSARFFLIKLLGNMEYGRVSLFDTKISVSGKPATGQASNMLDATAWAMPKGFELVQDLVSSKRFSAKNGSADSQNSAKGPYKWGVQKSKGKVLLLGKVPTEKDRLEALRLAKYFMRGIDVVDHQEIVPGGPPGMPTSRYYLIKLVGSLNSGRAHLFGNALSVSGKASRKDLADSISDTMANKLPMNYKTSSNVLFRLSKDELFQPGLVLDPIFEERKENGSNVDTYWWSVSKTAPEIILSGRTKNHNSSGKSLQEAKKVFAIPEIYDAQVINDYEPKGVEAVKNVLMRQVSLLDSGQGNIIGNQVSISGKAPNVNLRNLIELTLKNNLPEGFRGTTNIVYPIVEKLLATPVVSTAEFEDSAASVEAVISSDDAPDEEVITPIESAKEEIVEDCRATFLDKVGGSIILFESNQSIIKTESLDVLDGVVNAVSNCPNVKIMVAGHTDSSGSEITNQKLSEARANAVVNHMIKLGVSASRLEAQGFGESSPIADNSTPSGRLKNRRIEFQLLD